MKKQITYWLIMTIMVMAQKTFSQASEKREKDGAGKKIEHLRNEFYKEKLNLNEEQQKQFNPVFQEHHQKMKTYRKEIKTIQAGCKNAQTENALKGQIEKQEHLKKKLAEEEAQFQNQCISLIGVEKTALLIGLDDEFRKEMKKRIQERKKEKNKVKRQQP